MGVLFNFSLSSIVANGYDTLVETGTGTGTGIDYGLTQGFKRVFSTEIVTSQAEKLARQYAARPEVQISNLYSPDFLDHLFRHDIIKKDDRCVFWLDAHYPGGDLGHNAYGAEQDHDKRLPLEKELETLRAYKRTHDLIICDDLRIYERGPFDDGNLEDIGHADIADYDKPDFFARWTDTHLIERLYKHTGYIILRPHI